VAIIFWVCVALLLYSQVGYGLLLGLLARLLRHGGGSPVDAVAADGAAGAGEADDFATGDRFSRNTMENLSPVASGGGQAAAGGREPEGEMKAASGASTSAADGGDLPLVSVIVTAYHEQDVIAARIANLRELDYPAERLQIIVAVDGGVSNDADGTAERARAAGADLVLELPRGGKVAGQNAAVPHAAGDLLAFSDANVQWQHDALRLLVEAFVADPKLGYACGEVRFLGDDGANQEGLYWRYEMRLRSLESRLASITAGNGAIYAVRRSAYFNIIPLGGHDLAFPSGMVKRGWRAKFVPAARAQEKMAPSLEGEFARKRRMARRTWPTMFAERMFSLRGYSPLYALMICSHRGLRYLVPFLHVIALVASLVLVAQGWVYIAAAALQLALLVAAALAPLLPGRLAAVARYYVVTNTALAVGLWDWLRGNRSPVWETVAGTR